MALTMVSCVVLNQPVSSTQTPNTQTINTQTPGTQTSSPKADNNGLIAYLGPDGNLYTIDGQARNKTAITQDAQSGSSGEKTERLYAHPTWSFDGRQLAFVSLEAGNDDFLARVLVANVLTAEVTEIFSSEIESPFYLYWAPEGERVSFLASAPGSNELFLRFAYLNGEDSQVIDTGQPYYWVFAPDGSEIYIHKGGSYSTNPDARLTLLSLDDNQERRIPHDPANFQAPAWSPDGKYLLAAIQERDEKSLALLDEQGTLLYKLAEFEATLAFSWSPDGEHIAYLPTTLESQGTAGQVFVISAGSSEILYKTLDSNVIAYFWAPNSQKIAYFSTRNAQGLDSQVSLRVQETIIMDLKVLDLNTGESRYLTSFQPTADFLSVLPFYDQYHLSATIWSPDSTKLVYTSDNKEKGAGIWVVAVDGESQPIRIADGVHAFWSWK